MRSLSLGDVVYINGKIITGRDRMHTRVLEYLHSGKAVPEDIYESILFHSGPIMQKDIHGIWTTIAAGPTTSARMNESESEMIEKFRIRAIVGKGGMSSNVLNTMSRCGCVYMAATGGTAISLAEGLNKCIGNEWLDLGMSEAIWKFDAHMFGPLIIAMDCNNNSMYDHVHGSIIKDF